MVASFGGECAFAPNIEAAKVRVPDLTRIAHIKINKGLKSPACCDIICAAVIVLAGPKLANPDDAAMKFIAIVIAMFALASSSAEAWEIRTNCTNSRFFGKSCRTLGIDDQERDYAQEAADHRAKQERDKKWEAFCKPERTYDDLGVVRLVYTRSGCEFGRSE
jgi:hypothetical protein